MPTPSPPDFDIRTPANQLTWNAGFIRPLPEEGAWLPFQSPRTNGTLWLAGRKEGDHPAPVEWFLALNHPGLLLSMGTPAAMDGPGLARFSLPSTSVLFETLQRLYPLARDLPYSPAQAFAVATAGMPTETEVERLTIQRIGQALFREALLRHWNARCPITGITDLALLRASHIKPWADCTTTEERLDPMNGLLLSALWDAAFDRGLVSFSDDGEVLHSAALSAKARGLLAAPGQVTLGAGHTHYLSWHRRIHGFS
jgi:hypothetical protein